MSKTKNKLVEITDALVPEVVEVRGFFSGLYNAHLRGDGINSLTPKQLHEDIDSSFTSVEEKDVEDEVKHEPETTFTEEDKIVKSYN